MNTIDPDMLLADGFDEACIGVGLRAASPDIAVYSRAKCIKVLEKSGMSPEEAEEFFEFNVVGAYVGERTPLFFEEMDIADVRDSE